jgi:hypothetical protein
MVVVHIREGVGTRVPKYHLLKNIQKKFQGFFFQFCDVAHWQSSTRGIPNLATGQRGLYTNLKIILYLGHMLEHFV